MLKFTKVFGKFSKNQDPRHEKYIATEPTTAESDYIVLNTFPSSLRFSEGVVGKSQST